MTLGNGNDCGVTSPYGERNGHGIPIPRRFYFTIDCDWVPGSHVGLESYSPAAIDTALPAQFSSRADLPKLIRTW